MRLLSRAVDVDGFSAGGAGGAGGAEVGDDALAFELARWAALSRGAAAAGERTRERSLREQAAGMATWRGLLVDLAEAGTEVSIAVGSARLTGSLVGVGRDFCVLQLMPGGGSRRQSHSVLVSLSRVSALWGGPTPSGSRFAPLELSLVAALAALAEEHCPVRLSLYGGHQVSGELVSVGEDLLSVRTASPGRRLVHVQVSQLETCELR